MVVWGASCPIYAPDCAYSCLVFHGSATARMYTRCVLILIHTQPHTLEIVFSRLASRGTGGVTPPFPTRKIDLPLYKISEEIQDVAAHLDHVWVSNDLIERNCVTGYSVAGYQVANTDHRPVRYRKKSKTLLHTLITCGSATI